MNRETIPYIDTSKLFLRCLLTKNTYNIFYYKSFTNKPLITINRKKHIYYHTSTKILDELKKLPDISITTIPVKHNVARHKLYGVPCDPIQLEINGEKYIVIRFRGKNRKEVWKQALHVMDCIKEDYGIDLEVCEKDKIEE